MTAAAKPPLAIGFLTAVEHSDLGICGGYLILSPAGRPLEFHCTAPVRANLAQQILYGPTLRDYLYEQIAPALLSKAKAAPLLTCTDSPAMLAAADAADLPLVLLAAANLDQSGMATFALDANQVQLPLARAGEQAAIEERWRQLHATGLDLSEPFVRIREALEEAQRAAASKAAA